MIALWAALAMVAQDVFAVLLVQAEARGRAALSAVLDSLMWLASIATTTISVTALQSHHLGAKTVVIVAVSAANMVGSFSGVKIGERFIKAPCPHCAHLEKVTPV
jgi:hypothetical protein